MYTVEGRIKAVGAFARGLKNDDPRTKRFRRSMRHSALTALGIGGLVVAAIVLLQAIF
jgi:hypothetical protein